MKPKMVRKMMTVFILLTLPLLSHAASFDISWTGANNYRMTGMFSYSDSLINTGFINASHLDSLTIEGFLGKALLGSFQLDQTPINFNFDTSTQMFVTGGESQTTAGQQWNAPNTNGGLGFFSGNSTQGLYVKGALIHDSEIRIGSTVTTLNLVPSTLTATPILTTEMPEPSTWVLLVTGLIGFLAFTWCRGSSNGGKGNFQNKAG